MVVGPVGVLLHAPSDMSRVRPESEYHVAALVGPAALTTVSAHDIGDGSLKLPLSCVHIVRYNIGGRETEE